MSAFVSGDLGEVRKKLRAAKGGDLSTIGEIEAAKAHKHAGINVHFRKAAGDIGIANTRTSDFWVGGLCGSGTGGKMVEVFTPQTDSVRRIVGTLASKLPQADRFVLVLSYTHLDIQDVAQILPRINHVPGIPRIAQEITVVKNERIIGRLEWGTIGIMGD
ncbi:MAG: hypothetical protein DRR19_04580 [Candidatus Parabeggiatoa sp. nov. 1]|nr:MAG: hypothetical protein DRR19_04580 [Gammaproteobacteria bacterium]